VNLKYSSWHLELYEQAASLNLDGTPHHTPNADITVHNGRGRMSKGALFFFAKARQKRVHLSDFYIPNSAIKIFK
jgi:hypothetical protein